MWSGVKTQFLLLGISCWGWSWLLAGIPSGGLSRAAAGQQPITRSETAVEEVGHSQEMERQVRGGLDTLLLIDTSESMGRAIGEQEAGDKQGVRWDGVHLVLDIATFDDRVGLVTFGGKIRALQVPGNEDVLVALTEANRAELKDQLSRIWPDNGGTPILDTLRQAADHFRRQMSAQDGLRNRQILLLSDGHETIHWRKASQFRQVQAYLRFFREHEIPIHAIGMGPSVNEPLLANMAHYTRGSFRQIESNAELLQAMREIHWAGKHLWWIRRTQLHPDRGAPIEVAGGEVGGLIDLGILVYSERGTPPRIARQPRVAPVLEWRSPAGPIDAPGVQARLRTHETYWFNYIGPDSEQFPLAALTDDSYPVVRLAAPEPQTVIFVRRTVQPLFSLESPRGEAHFRFGEPIPLRVDYYPHPAFQPQDFLVTAELHDAQNAYPLRTAELSWNAAEQQFEQAWVVPPEDPTVGEGYYDVLIQVEGQEGGLAGHQLQLPRRTIQLGGNFHLIRPGQDLVLDANNDYQARVTVAADTQATFPVTVSLHPPTLDGEPVGSADLFDIQPAEHQLEAGQIELSVSLRADHDLPFGETFEPGYVELGGRYVVEPLRIPLRVSLGLLEVGLEPSSIPPLVVKGMDGQARTAALQLVAAQPEVPSGLECRLRLEVPEGLEASEIGIVTRTEEVGSQEKTLAIGDQFHVVFMPQAGRREGRYQGNLRIDGPGVETRAYDVFYEVNIPLVELESSLLVETVAVGQTVDTELELQLKDGEDALEVYVQAVQGPGSRVVFETESGQRQSLEVRAPSADEPMTLNRGEAMSLPLQVVIPEAADCGEYTAEFQLRGRNLAPLPFRLRLRINTLKLQYRDWEEQIVWQEARDIQVFAAAEHNRRLHLAVRDVLGDDFRLEDLEILREDPRSSSGHLLAHPEVEPGETPRCFFLVFSVPRQALFHEEYQLQLRVVHKKNRFLRTTARIRLIVDNDIIRIVPPNPVRFLLTASSGQLGLSSATRDVPVEMSLDDLEARELRHAAQLETRSPQYLQWEIEPRALERVGGSPEERIEAEHLAIAYLTQKPIRAGEPGRFEVVLTPPAGLRPGVYEGSFPIQLVLLASEEEHERSLAVRVIVSGRELGRPRLLTGEDTQVFAGRDTEVEFTLDSVDPQPGAGTLVLSRVDTGDAQPAEQVAPVSLSLEPEEIQAAGKGQDRMHRFQVRKALPITQPGLYRLDIRWPLLGDTLRPGQAELEETLTWEAFPALTASERFPFLNEWTTVRLAVTPAELLPFGIHVRVQGSGTDGPEVPQTIFLRDCGDWGQFADEVAGDGIYSTWYQFRQPGRHTFQLQAEDFLGSPVAPATSEVLFALEGPLGLVPHIRTDPVIHWPLEGTDDLTVGIQSRLSDVLTLYSDQASTVEWTVHVEQPEPYDAERDPRLQLALAASNEAGGAGAEQQQGQLEDGHVSFDLVLELPPIHREQDEASPFSWRSDQPFQVVVHLAGTGPDGEAWDREIKLPFHVVIAEGSQLWLVIGAATLALLLVIGAVLGLLRSRVWPPSHQADSSLAELDEETWD